MSEWSAPYNSVNIMTICVLCDQLSSIGEKNSEARKTKWSTINHLGGRADFVNETP